MGMAQRSAGLGRFVGPAWGGASFEFLGRDWPAFAGAVVMVAMVLLALRIARQPRRKALTPGGGKTKNPLLSGPPGPFCLNRDQTHGATL